MKRISEPLQSVLVSGQGVAVHEGVEARIFSLHDNVETGGHSSEERIVEGEDALPTYFLSGNPKHQWFSNKCKITQV